VATKGDAVVVASLGMQLKIDDVYRSSSLW
jgi:hypothetical protein